MALSPGSALYASSGGARLLLYQDRCCRASPESPPWSRKFRLFRLRPMVAEFRKDVNMLTKCMQEVSMIAASYQLAFLHIDSEASAGSHPTLMWPNGMKLI